MRKKKQSSMRFFSVLCVFSTFSLRLFGIVKLSSSIYTRRNAMLGFTETMGVNLSAEFRLNQ